MSLLLLAQVDTMLFTASRTFWIPKCDVCRSSVDIFFKVVDGMWVSIGHQWLADDARGERIFGREVRRSWWHSVVPQCPVHPVRLAPRQRDEVVLHRAESKPNIVLRVGLHPRTIATSHSTTGGTLWRTLPLIPAVLVPRECSHVERTTRLFWG